MEVDLHLHAPLVDAVLADPDEPLPPEPVTWFDPGFAVDVPVYGREEADVEDEAPLPEPSGPSEREVELEEEVEGLRRERDSLLQRLQHEDRERNTLESRLAEMAAAVAVAEEQAAQTTADNPEDADEAEQRLREERDRLIEQWHEENAAVQQATRAMTQAVDSLHEEFHGVIEELRTATTDLAVAIASRLLHDRIQADDYPVERLIQNVVQRLEATGKVSVRLHPGDLALLERRLGENERLFDDNRRVELVADDSLSRGDCKASAGDVSVASFLQDQLEDIRQHLLVSE
ncbi:MAG: hypothetical protein KY476_26930 [Planctomycetes bacterium]|nr:hypothetical protein [Planctomycetota bacterium]